MSFEGRVLGKVRNVGRDKYIYFEEIIGKKLQPGSHELSLQPLDLMDVPKGKHALVVVTVSSDSDQGGGGGLTSVRQQERNSTEESRGGGGRVRSSRMLVLVGMLSASKRIRHCALCRAAVMDIAPREGGWMPPGTIGV